MTGGLAAPPWRRAFFRLPWLIVGLAGSAAATGLMSAFEAELAKSIAIAFFVPAVVYIADAVGTQSEAVAVRGLSLTRGNLWPLLAGEIATGALIGLAIAVLAFPAVGLAFADWNLAGAVAMSVWVASSIATAIGFGLPWLFDRFSIDPALGSGPIATVIQDVLSILVYLLIASWLVLG